MLSEKTMKAGFVKRFEVFRKMLGNKIDKEEYIDVAFNYAGPQNASELLDNVRNQFDMGAISKRSIIEKSPLTFDVDQELNRLNEVDSGVIVE